MTKTISTLLTGILIFILLIITSISTQAASYWKLEVSTPASVLQSSTFNLDYSILASETNENFKVELVANSTVVETQNVTTGDKFGVNGRFTKTNVPEGTYTYFVRATASDASVQQSTARTVTVNLPDSQTVVASSVNGQTNVTAVRTNTTADGTEVATAVTTATPITETSSTQSNTAVQGASDNNSRNFTIAGLLLLALAGGVIWYGVSNYLNKKDV